MASIIDIADCMQATPEYLGYQDRYYPAAARARVTRAIAGHGDLDVAWQSEPDDELVSLAMAEEWLRTGCYDTILNAWAWRVCDLLHGSRAPSRDCIRAAFREVLPALASWIRNTIVPVSPMETTCTF